MTKAEIVAALSDPRIQDSDPVKFLAADGTEKQVVSIDRVGDVAGVYPATEPNAPAYVKVQLGS